LSTNGQGLFCWSSRGPAWDWSAWHAPFDRNN